MPVSDDCIDFIDEGTHIQNSDNYSAKEVQARPMTTVRGR